MRPVMLGILAIAFSAPVFAQTPPPPPGQTASAPGAIAGGKVVSFDPAKHLMTVDANGQQVTVDTTKAAVAGVIAPGAVVDVTFANGAASAVAVRPAAGGTPAAQGSSQQHTVAATGSASGPGAIAGGKVLSFDPQKHQMVVDSNGQQVTVMLGSAVVNGEIMPGKIVDVSFANGAAAAVNVRP